METQGMKQEEAKENGAKQAELAVVDRLADRLVWLKDGRVLRDTGDGPRPWKKVKAGREPSEAFQHWSEQRKQWLAEHPAFDRLQKFMVRNFNLDDRLLVLTALGALANDADGLWAEMNDAGIEISVEEAHELCRLFIEMEAEPRGPAEQTATANQTQEQ